jgi:hypothetical protein
MLLSGLRGTTDPAPAVAVITHGLPPEHELAGEPDQQSAHGSACCPPTFTAMGQAYRGLAGSV